MTQELSVFILIQRSGSVVVVVHPHTINFYKRIILEASPVAIKPEINPFSFFFFPFFLIQKYVPSLFIGIRHDSLSLELSSN